MNILVGVAKRVATPPSDAVIVCGNSDYTLTFDFDAEWSAETVKIARYVWFSKNKAHSEEITFEGNTVAVPILSNTNAVYVGVYAGNLRTTTPAKIVCEPSILCYGQDANTNPSDMALIKGQIAELVKALKDISVDPTEIKNAVTEYLVKNPVKESDPTVPAWAKQPKKPTYTADEVGAVASSELSNAVNDALAQAKASGEFDGRDGDPGKPGKDGQDYVLTPDDIAEIAEMAAKLVEVPAPDSGGNVDYVLPVGGNELGGVKNGGNVVINADGTMTAPESEVSDEQVEAAVNAYLEENPVDGVNWTDPEDEESFGETGTEGEPEPEPEPDNPDDPGGEESSYVTDNLAVMYDFTRYEDGYQGEVEDLSGNGVVPTITGLDVHVSGRQGFIGGKLMLGKNINTTQSGLATVNACTITVDCDAVKSYPYSIEVYGFLRRNFNIYVPVGTVEYSGTSGFNSWEAHVASTKSSSTTSVNGWDFRANENYLGIHATDTVMMGTTDIELSIGGVNNTNVTGPDTHLVYCVDGNQQKIYLNGVLVASAELTRNHGTTNILKLFPSKVQCDLKMFRLYKSVLSDFDVYSNYQQAVSSYGGATPVMLTAEVTEESTEEDTVTRKVIKEMANFPVTLARATYMNNSNTTVEDEILKLKNGGANSATVVRSAEVGDTGVVAFKNAIGITVFEADLAHMDVGALQLPRVYLTGSTVGMGADAPVKMAFKFVDAEQTITGWADVEWQGNTSIGFPIKNYGIDLYEDEAMETEMDISVLPHMATDSYHLKANYIDPSNTKNLAGARLFKYICDTVGLTFPNSARCVVDGRPVEVYLNGKFNGIYTFNYKQSKSLFGMGDGGAEFIYRCEIGGGWGSFTGDSFPTKEEFDKIWEARYPKPEKLTHHNEIQRMLKWVNDATNEEFKANIGSYLNLQSCLIYRICGDIMAFRDNSAKNLTVCSWDGQVWYTIPYDMDMGMMDKSAGGMFGTGGNLWSKIDSNFDAEKKALYAQLRDAGMDANTIFKLYSDILYPIGMNGYTADRKVKYDPYTNLDGRVSFVDFDDYIGFHKEFIQKRIELMDTKYGYTAT